MRRTFALLHPPAVAIVLAAWVVFIAAPAVAGSVEVVGPPGTRLLVDGQDAGVLPLDHPLTLSSGEHRLVARLSGHHDFDTTLAVGDADHWLLVELRLSPLSRTNAVARSLLFAGLGQHYVGRRTTGWVLTLAEVAGIAGFVVGDLVFRSKRDDFEEAFSAYRAAVAEVDIVRLRQEAEAAYADMLDAEDLRDGAFAVAVGAVALSVLDVALRFPSVQAGAGEAPLLGAAGGDGAGARGVGHLREIGGIHGGDVGFHLGLRMRF